jgi:hypothetical protein
MGKLAVWETVANEIYNAFGENVFTREQAEELCLEKTGKRLASNTWKALINRGVVIASGEHFICQFKAEDKATLSSKEGQNHNDHIFTLEEVYQQMKFEDFSLSTLFQRIGVLKIEPEKERVVPIPDDVHNNGFKKENALYAFVIDGHLFKIGKTDTTIAERINSYNCGKKKHREKGTCSTTNYMVLQTFLAINKEVEVYCYFLPKATLVIDGKTYEITESPSKFAEGLFLEKVISENNNNRLLGCVQK